MRSDINIEQVRAYNASLREYKEKSSKLRAEIEFNQKELDKQCSELSASLGIQVTPDNIQQILEERVAKIKNTMEVGTEILNRIKNEEATISQVNSQMPGQIPVQPTVQMPTTQPTVQPGSPVPPVAPNIQGGAASVFGDMSGGLPPIFANPNL
jgi:predicted lipase